jgi:hypothetical protein
MPINGLSAGIPIGPTVTSICVVWPTLGTMTQDEFAPIPVAVLPATVVSSATRSTVEDEWLALTLVSEGERRSTETAITSAAIAAEAALLTGILMRVRLSY